MTSIFPYVLDAASLAHTVVLLIRIILDSIVAIMVFLRESEASAIAQLKKSMLGARLATVAGMKDDGLKGQ